MAEIVVKVPLHEARELWGGGIAERLKSAGIDTSREVRAAGETEACCQCGTRLMVFTGTLREDYGGVEVEG